MPDHPGILSHALAQALPGARCAAPCEPWPAYQPRALFAVSSLGLGHATRSLVVIRDCRRRGYAVSIVSAGNALAFLKLELAGDPGVEFCELTDYPPLERGTGWRLYAYLLIDLLRTWQLIRAEHAAVQAVAANYDFIFSDGRYGFHSRATPSFILSHQIAFMPPRGLREAAWLTEHVNVAALRRFDCLLIPDYPTATANLAGHLAHSPQLHRCRHRYVGILSSYRDLGLEPDIDYLFVISGYLLEHKDGFVRDLLRQATELPGHKVFVLGATDGDTGAYGDWARPDLEIHAVASGEQRQDLFNRARCVISRAGYTTVMDLVEHDKPAVLIPTPNQTEQEYLADFLGHQGYFAVGRQGPGFQLRPALETCAHTRRFAAPWRTGESLARVWGEMAPWLHRHYISIVVPAHNEARELAATLNSLLAQNYPPERHEVLVVENGSTDATLEIAREIAARSGGRLRVLQSEIGVSRARNRGIEGLAPECEWVVFCDADTRLGPHFLHHLNTWLNRHGEGLSVGTSAVRPAGTRHPYARLWFRLYDAIHRLTQSSFSLQIARSSVARGVRYREDLHFAEDLRFIRDCRRYGRFFFLPTDQVETSTRRFEAHGYLRQGLRWLVQALLPERFKRQRPYHVVR